MNSIGKNFQATDTIEQKITFFIDLLSSVSTLTYESFYLLDLSNKRLLYVSENPFPLYKLSQEELISKGFDFYLSFLNEKEREFFLWLQRVGRKKMNEVDESRRLSSFLTYDFHVCLPNKKQVLVNRKIKPLTIGTEKDIELALAIDTLSSNTHWGNIRFYSDDPIFYEELSLATLRWEKKRKVVLTPAEQEMVILSSQGWNMKQIAEMMNKSVDSIKHYRKKLLEKMGVKNIGAAIVASINGRKL